MNKSELLNLVIKAVFVIVFSLSALLFALSTRYAFEPLGRSRDACLVLDKWTGRTFLSPIDASMLGDLPKSTPAQPDRD